MSSNQPDDGCCEVYGCEEVCLCLVVSCGDGAIEFEFGEEVFDQVPRFVEFLVVFALDFAVGFGRNHRDFACFGQRKQHSLVGVEAFVAQHGAGFDLRQQRVGSVQVAGLSWREMESGRVAKSIDGGVDLGAQPAFAASDGLIAAPFLRAPALC